jgi:hypothetical protein
MNRNIQFCACLAPQLASFDAWAQGGGLWQPSCCNCHGLNSLLCFLCLPFSRLVSPASLHCNVLPPRNTFGTACFCLQDRSAPATFFWPLDSAWAPIQQQLCMTVKQIQDTLASAPDVAVQYMNINIVNGALYQYLAAAAAAVGMEAPQ